ncbi:hypothetical protein GPALN_013200, partial [Globodera pallida]
MALSNDIDNETEDQYDEVFLDETENNNPKLDLCEPATSLLRYFQFQRDFCAAKASKTVQKRKTNPEESSSQKSVKQMSLDLRVQEKWPITHQKSQKIDELILRFICLSAEPIQLTEKNAFSEIFDE